MFFTFPENARWDGELQAVEVRGGNRRIPQSWSGHRERIPTLISERPTPERCVEAFYLQRTRFESIAGRTTLQYDFKADSMTDDKGEHVKEVFGHFGSAYYLAGVFKTGLAYALLSLDFMRERKLYLQRYDYI